MAPDADPSLLDLRGTPCPLNYVRSRLALEKLPPGAVLLVDLDRGEPERMVAEGLTEAGHRVEVLADEAAPPGAVRLRLHRG